LRGGGTGNREHTYIVLRKTSDRMTEDQPEWYGGTEGEQTLTGESWR